MNRPRPPEPPRAPLTPEESEMVTLRYRLACKVGRLDRESLRRVVDLLDAMSDDDARRVAAFAVGLAEWPEPEASST
jgi:hypothetical protein